LNFDPTTTHDEGKEEEVKNGKRQSGVGKFCSELFYPLLVIFEDVLFRLVVDFLNAAITPRQRCNELCLWFA
jgi:hypothetical protein